MNLVYKSITEPIRDRITWHERWGTPEKSLVTAWEAGREIGSKNLEIANKAKNGELPVLPCKGGVEKKIQKKEKYGSLLYLAQWQGLRGEDLNIDLSKENYLICSKTEMLVKFTLDERLLFNE